MEVHHPHSTAHRKDWKEYLLEGIMIFVAVSMGFIAEQIREHVIDRHHEQVYMESMVQDLRSDSIQLQRIGDAYLNRFINSADSIPLLLTAFDPAKPANSLYYHLRLTIRFLTIRVYIHDRTITQLKNSGSMRIVENKKVSDSIIDYYNKIDVIRELEDYLYKEKNELRQILPVLLKGEMYDKVIDESDKLIHPEEALYARAITEYQKSELMLKVSDIKGLSKNIHKRILVLQEQADRLRRLILSSYRISEHSVPAE
jgi:hypothetical protein